MTAVFLKHDHVGGRDEPSHDGADGPGILPLILTTSPIA